MKKLILYSFLLFFFACSKDEAEDYTYRNYALCVNGNVVKIIDEPIPADVKVVKEREYFFNGHREFLEVDAQKYLKDVFKESEPTTIRIFVPGKDLRNKEGEVMFKGMLSDCHSGDHGQLTNNIWYFYLLEDAVIE